MVQGLFVLCLLGFSRSLAISVTHSVTPHSITVSWSDGAAYLYKPILKLDKSIVSSAVLPATADEYTFTGLKSNTEYDLSLKTVNLVGKEETPYPDTKVKVLAAAPRSPQDLVYTKVSSNSISLSWENDPSDKDGVSYDVVYGTKDGNTMRKETLSSSINLDNLEEGKYYYVSVYAKKGDLQSPPSRIGPIFTHAIPSVPLTIKHISGNTYQLTWDFTTGNPSPICPIYSNNINIVNEKSGRVYRYSVSPTTQTYIHEFDSDSVYKVTVTGDCISRVGIYAANSSFTPIPQPPSAPTGLLVNSVTETSIAVSWQPPIKPNGQISGYIVTLVEEQQTKDTTELTHTFQGLKSAHRYTIQVQAKNTMTGPAASVRVTTKPSADQKPAPPAMSQDVDMSPLGARVKWTAVPLATGYRVSYWPEGQENMGNSKVVGAETSALLTGLNKGEKYMANVVAFTYLVTSDASNTISFIYDNGIPNLPSNLMAKVVGIGMIHVTWDKPKTRAETEINAEVYKGSSSVRSVKGPESSGLLEISELPAFSVLAVKVWATKDGYKSAEKFFDGLETPPPAPEPPASVASEGVSASSIKITWQLPPDNTFIESSEVTVKESSTNEMSFTDSFKKSVDSVQVDKLKPYTVYNVDLKTKSYKYEGLSGNAESAVVSTTTQTWPTGPAEVGIPDQAVQLTADGGVKATWSPPTELIGEVERYYVRAVNNANSGSLGEQSSSGDVTSATFTGIPGKTQVAVYVRTGVKPAMGGVGGFESNDVLLGLVTTPDNGIVGDYSGGLSGGAIAGIVIAILIVLIILAIVVYKMTKGNQVEEVEFEWSEDGGDNGDDAQNGPRDKIELREGAKAPEVKAPEVKAPEVKAPEVKAPEVKAPEVKASEVKAPEVKLDRNEVAF